MKQLLPLVVVPLLLGADDWDTTEEYLEWLAETSVSVVEPLTYLEGNGFVCRPWPQADETKPYFFCDIDLDDAQMYFVGLLQRDDGWRIETKGTYPGGVEDNLIPQRN